MSAVIYTKPNCPSCIKAKNLLRQNNIQYGETVIGEDIIREDFLSTFPDQKTVPLIIIEGQKVGGFEDLVEWLNNRPQLLSE